MNDKEAKLILEAMSRRDFLDRLGKGIATVSKLSGLQLPNISTPAAAISPDAPYIQSLFNVEDGRLNHELSGVFEYSSLPIKLDSLTALPGGVFVDNNLPNKQGYIYFPEDMLWAGVDPEIRRAAKGYSLRYDVAAGKPVGWGGRQTHRPSIIELVDKLLYKIFGQLPQTDPADQQANQDDPSSDSTRKPRGGQPRRDATARFSMPIVHDPDYDPDWGYPESKQLTFKQFFNEADDISRRDFLGKLGKGVSMAANLPWTKLFSAPELATKVAAPFLMGTNKVINPLQMYQAFYKRIREQWAEEVSGNIHGASTSSQQRISPYFVIPEEVIQYVAKNMLEYTMENFEYTDNPELHYFTDILDELDKGKQHVLDDPWVPQYIKDDVAANYHETEEGKPSGDIEDLNHDNIVASYLPYDKANNQELLDDNIEDSLERALGSSRDNWTRAYEESVGSPLLSSILDYIEDLLIPSQDREPMSAEDIVKMDFKSEILPGTVNWLRALKVQDIIDHERYNQDVAKQQADKETDARNKDYLDRRPSFPELPDHGRGWESKKIKTDADLIFEAYSEADMSRRTFLGKLGKGLSLVANIPWTKLISAPQLAATVTAPFKIGAGTMLNPQALHWYYVRKFYNKALDSSLTPVDVTDERHYEYDHTEISTKAFDWVAKNVINMYVDDVGHSTDREGNTVAPTLSELINHMGEEKEHFIDDPNFPEWAKPLLAKDEEDMTDEEEERYQNLMNSKWFDKQMVINWDGEWGHGADEEIEEMLRDWTGWHHNNPQWERGSAEPELITTVFDYIVDLNRKRNDEGKFMDIDEIMKMDFKTEFLPGVVKYAREMAIVRQTQLTGNQQRQAGQDAQKAKDELQKDQLPKRDDVSQDVEWWHEDDFKWWDRRFDDDVINSDKIEQYKVIADKIIQNPFENGLLWPSTARPDYSAEESQAKIKKLKQEAHDWLRWYNGTKDSRKPNQAHIKHPYGVGRPQSALQTASTKPTFKEFFNEFAWPAGQARRDLDNDLIKQLYNQGFTGRDIGKRLGVNRSTIYDRLKQMGVEVRPPHGIHAVGGKAPLIDLDDDLIKQLYSQGYTTREIAKQLGTGHTTILKHLKQMGVERRPASPPIPLDNEIIKQMYEDGFSSYEIAEELGVSNKTILKRLKAMGVPIRPPGYQPFMKGSYKGSTSASSQRTRNITGPGNVGGAHQTFPGSSQTVQTNLPGPRRGKGH